MGSLELPSDEFGEMGTLEPVVRTPLGATVHEMPGVGVPGDLGLVVVALVQKLAGEDGQTAPLHLQGHEVGLVVVDVVVELVGGDAVGHFGPVVQFALVAARQAPQAPVGLCCRLQRDPEP